MMRQKPKRGAAKQKRSYSFLKILTGTDLSRRRLPVMRVQSVHPGPVVWLTACIHGDEAGGIVVIQEVFKRLAKSNLLKGTLHAFPLMNPMGFDTLSRNITYSKEDLNRAFPGNSAGTLAERLAHIIFESIRQTGPDLVIDLHNDWIRSVPYALLDPSDEATGPEIARRSRHFAGKAGLLVVEDSEAIKRSLSYNLIHEGIPAISLELGASYILQEANVSYGVESVWNILASLEMITTRRDPFRYDYPGHLEFPGNVLTYSGRPMNSKSGIVRFLVKPGELIQPDQPLARIFNAFGKKQETLHAQQHGIVLGLADSPVVFPGMSLIASGVTDPQWGAAPFRV